MILVCSRTRQGVPLPRGHRIGICVTCRHPVHYWHGRGDLMCLECYLAEEPTDAGSFNGWPPLTFDFRSDVVALNPMQDAAEVFQMATLIGRDSASAHYTQYNPLTLEDAEDVLQYWRGNDAVFYTVLVRGLPSGMLSVLPADRDSQFCRVHGLPIQGTELGVWVRPSLRGQRLASHVISAFLGFAISTDRVEPQDLVAIVSSANVSSHHMMRHVGFTPVGDVDAGTHPDGHPLHVEYRLDPTIQWSAGERP
jgi:RimJ/RimL family protein N-acetyltransferase